ncbi:MULTISPECIES: O-antigen ligase family protein [Deinococcus]|uniref:O-antigen ligase family protein n=1 Tax=Deinococcus rufus TaxID=2136097 RepID=A0ABV7ZFA1_9DEIO|nr:O-antigen ligase family protein [Deinococcus sp. AB2017081]WQE94032.1 O-antigen ligase family protein [Deinococcus sp. AB2017081]
MTPRTVGILALVLFLLHDHLRGLFPFLPNLQLPLAGLAALCAVIVGWRLTRSALVMLGVAGLAGVAVLTAPEVTYMTPYSDSKQTLVLLTLAFTLILPPLLIQARDHLRQYLNALGLVCVLIVAGTLPALPSIVSESGRLAIGEDGNPIWLARAAGIAALWVGVSVLTGRLRRPWLWALAPILGIIVLTGSRGPLASLLIVLALLLPLLVRRVTLPGLAVMLASAGAGLAVFFNPMVLDGVLARFAREDRYGVTSGRDTLWAITTGWIQDVPGGIGLGGLAASLMPYARYPHNIVLETFAELGWVAGTGLVIALGLALYRLARAARSRQFEEVMLLGVFLFALGNALVSGDLTGPKELYIAAALSVMVPGLYRRAHHVFPDHGRRDLPDADVFPERAVSVQ